MRKIKTQVTLPQRGERVLQDGERVKLPRNLRHKKLKPYYAMVTRVARKKTKLPHYTKLVSREKANTLVYGRLVANPVTGIPNVVMPSRQYAFA